MAASNVTSTEVPASNKSPSTVFVSKITPCTGEQPEEDHVSSQEEPANSGKDHMSSDKESSGEVKIEVNGHVTPPSSSARPPSSSACSQDGCSSSASSVSLASQDQTFASREALIEQLTIERNLDKTDKDVVTQLLEHIVHLKMEMGSLCEENRRLKGQRTAMDDELHTLTENLFEEAYKMVDEAKGGKMSAEKRLADATGKIDAMETEMSALRNLLTVPSDRPTSPHKHSRSPSVRRMLKKMKSGSSTKSKKAASNSPTPVQGTPIKVVEHRTVMEGESLCEGDISPQDFQEFSQWLEGLSTSAEHKYIDNVIDVDVRQCLRFHDDRISEQVLVAVRENDLLMEALPTSETRKCSLSGNGGVVCTHRLKLGSSDDWLYISQWCRDRIAAACDFYMYIGHIKKGIVKLDATKLYWQVRKLRAMMSLARLSLKLPQ